MRPTLSPWSRSLNRTASNSWAQRRFGCAPPAPFAAINKSSCGPSTGRFSQKTKRVSLRVNASQACLTERKWTGSKPFESITRVIFPRIVRSGESISTRILPFTTAPRSVAFAWTINPRSTSGFRPTRGSDCTRHQPSEVLCLIKPTVIFVYR